MNPTIDLSTGLPVLPEGYFWRIDQSYEINLDEEDNHLPLTVNIVERVTQGYYELEEREKVETQSVFGIKVKKKVPVLEKVWRQRQVQRVVATGKGVDAGMLEPDLRRAIEAEAVNVYNHWLHCQHREANAKKFVGEYPPKSIN